MGLMDLLVSKRQRIANQKRRMEKENRELEDEVELKRLKDRNNELRKQLLS